MKESEILADAFEKIKTYLNEDKRNTSPVVKFKAPAELKKLINFKNRTKWSF